MNYYTSTPNAPPQALGGLTAIPVQGYGQNFADNFGKMSQANAVDYRVAAAKAADEYEQARRKAVRDTSLSGLKLLADAQEQRNSLANSQLQSMTGFAGILGGLFN